jgi:hypothetical protein
VAIMPPFGEGVIRHSPKSLSLVFGLLFFRTDG